MSNETPTLRLAVASDAASVRALTRAAYAQWVPRIGREPKPMGADYDAAVARHRIDLAYLGDELAALIETIPGTGYLLVENVAVAPAFQGRGLGRFLMAHAERLAAEQGHAEIRLYTNKMFAENVELYRRLGYRIDREEESALGVTVYMSKAVAITVFFYGLFMDAAALRANGFHPANARQACVSGMALQIGQRATLIPDPAGRVFGFVMDLSQAEVDRLYAEPSVAAYRPEAVMAQLGDGSRIAALCFNLPPSDEPVTANPEYAGKLRVVAARLGLPSDYVSGIR